MTDSNSPATPSQPALISCPDCDLLMDADITAGIGASIRCPRCATELFRVHAGGFERTLAFASTALILFLIANVFPIVGLNLQGHLIEVTLIGAAKQLWKADMEYLGALVGITTIVIPLFELLAVMWLISPLTRGRQPPGFAALLRIMHLTHPWGMVEVFMLGVLVSLVKLAHLAQVIPGIGIWAYGGVMLLITAIASSYDQRKLWRAWEEARP